MIHHGDCLEIMPTLPAESIDAIVTDPPYLIGFMGKEWDGPASFVERKSVRRAGSFEASHGNHNPTDAADAARTRRSENQRAQAWHEAWAREAFRVAKPGAHLLAFGGTRTYHRLACAIEDAGWEIRDCLVWAYASGFPKSRNLDGEWQGWGTALKPAWEPIILARKPLRGTVAANVQRYGTGALNIDGCRIAGTVPSTVQGGQHSRGGLMNATGGERSTVFDGSPLGRWPANLILTDPIFDGDTPGVVGGGRDPSQTATYATDSENVGYGGLPSRMAGTTVGYGDSGTYSRFFLVPKAARSDREPVLRPDGHEPGKRFTTHPTVKPTELMRHLVRLVTPPGGMVLDPFLGSGSTALACEQEGFAWVGIEKEAEYVAIAEARLNGTQRGIGL